MTALPQDAVLKSIAAWAMPDWEWSGFIGGAHEVEKQQLWFIQAAEQVAVERGLGERLVRHRCAVLGIMIEPGLISISGVCVDFLPLDDVSRVSDAPLEARALALHRLVCELEKEKHDAEA